VEVWEASGSPLKSIAEQKATSLIRRDGMTSAFLGVRSIVLVSSCSEGFDKQINRYVSSPAQFPHNAWITGKPETAPPKPLLSLFRHDLGVFLLLGLHAEALVVVETHNTVLANAFDQQDAGLYRFFGSGGNHISPFTGA